MAVVFSSCNDPIRIEGIWVEPVPGMEGQFQGFRLDKNGEAASVNMATLQYEAWRREGNLLILTGKSIGNRLTLPFSDTLVVEELTRNCLVLKKRSLILRYCRANEMQTEKGVSVSELTPATRPSFQTKGILVFAHETRSFTPSGDSASYWIVDKTGRLMQEYDEMTGGVKNGTPVYADLEVIDVGKSKEGFAEAYKSVYQVLKINKLSMAKPEVKK